MTIIIGLSEESAELIKQVLERANFEDNRRPHGDLTIETLAEMLLEDVAMVLLRPGSWEGTNMAQVLASHGYEV